MMRNKNAQSFIEYCCILAVIISAIIVMSVYIKRGAQGNWRNNVVSLFPEFYNPDPVDGTAEIVPLRIQVSDYNFNIQEAGKPASAYRQDNANWIGPGWKIWSRKES